jgi:hypothetical protein
MGMITKAEISTILIRLGEVYGKEIGADMLIGYFQVLSKYPRMVLADAASLWMQKSEYMPRPSDLIKVINDFNLENKWLSVEASTEKTYWILFKEGYDSTDDINEQECQYIFGKEYVGPKKIRSTGAITLEEARKLYVESKKHEYK